MKQYTLSTAVNQLDLGKTTITNKQLNVEKGVPYWANTEDIINIFLPRLTIIDDSREQSGEFEDLCKRYGINFIRAKKGEGTDNLKEGDYTFIVQFDNNVYSYIGLVSYELKRKISEFYGNCIKGRQRVKREFERFGKKQYEKTVLMLEFANTMTDLVGAEFTFWQDGRIVRKNTGKVMFSTVMSWKQPNNNNFDVIMATDPTKLFWLMIVDMFYYFRNDIRLECIEKGLIKNEQTSE
jgi:hypothetical protein